MYIFGFLWEVSFGCVIYSSLALVNRLRIATVTDVSM